MTQPPSPSVVGSLVRDAGDSIAREHDLAAGTTTLRRRLDVAERRDPAVPPAPARRGLVLLGAAAAVVLVALLVWAAQGGSRSQLAPPAHGSSAPPRPSPTVTTALPVGVWSGPVGQQSNDRANPGHSVILRVNTDGSGSYDVGFVVPMRVVAAGSDTVSLVDTGHVQGRAAQCTGAIGTYRVRAGSGGTISLVRTATGPCTGLDDGTNVLGQITFRPS